MKTATKERPILFSDPMVRAILDDKKTQTRRTVIPQPPEGLNIVGPELYHTARERDGILYPGPQVFGAYSDDGEWGIKCPYGQPGDRLWVRECWRVVGWHFGEEPEAIQYRDGTGRDVSNMDDADYERWSERICEQCCEDFDKAGFVPEEDDVYRCHDKEIPTRWRPSIHMPRWCSRITLDIKAVRIERLHCITEADAKAEGFSRYGDPPEWCPECKGCGIVPAWAPGPAQDSRDCRTCATAYGRFQALWDKLNGAKFPWSMNPWVWVVEFERAQS